MVSRFIYINLLIISASLICFEVITTRISSVIFVNNYAFMILSFAILGLGAGGICAYYKGNNFIKDNLENALFKILLFISASYLAFVLILLLGSVTNQFIFFIILFPPYFLSGIYYAIVFEEFSRKSFQIYAFDLIGAALGAVCSIFIFQIFSATIAIVVISLITLLVTFAFYSNVESKKIILSISILLIVADIITLILGYINVLPTVPIGVFDEKDYHYVYDNVRTTPTIVDSRWSVYGRSDLVEYSHQKMVKQLFIDGSAGTPMYHFSGDVNEINPTLYNLLLNNTTTIPLLSLKQYEKESMLVIGPGGGKEVLTGLLLGIDKITGIEINKDFIDIVKSQSSFNGGIYTRFPNVEILAKEGRHFIKRTSEKFDLIVMALPSTEQLQSIDNFAMNENYLLTVEALKDYLNVLTSEGRLVFTVHNRWELIRLMTTTLSAFKLLGIENKEAFNHILLFRDDYAPTIVIKKEKFKRDEVINILNTNNNFPSNLPKATYLPYNTTKLNTKFVENRLINAILNTNETLENYIKKDRYDISPIYDDSPYFYKVERGIPDFYKNLFYSVLIISLMLVFIPFIKIKRNLPKKGVRQILNSVLIFVFLGIGFMVLEVSLFQKLILYLGSPTISLSVLLASLLIGMGIGSYFSKKIFVNKYTLKVIYTSLGIFLAGLVVYYIYPILFSALLVKSQLIRSTVAFFLILPFGLLLGIPFPTMISLLHEIKFKNYIPWLYGINGVMSVLGSILAVIFSMLVGFNFSFIIGLLFYLLVALIAFKIKTVG